VHPVVVVDASAPLDETIESVRVVDPGTVAQALLGHGQRWGADLVEEVAARCDAFFSARAQRPAGRRAAEDDPPEQPAEPATPEGGDQPDGGDMPDVADLLDVALVESMLASPVEEWAVRLHPVQA